MENPPFKSPLGEFFCKLKTENYPLITHINDHMGERLLDQ